MMKIVAKIVEDARISKNTCKDGYVLVTLDYAVKDCTGRVIRVSEKKKSETSAMKKMPFYVKGRIVEVTGKEVVDHVSGNCLYHDLKGYGWLK